jgi:hypothetical protein
MTGKRHSVTPLGAPIIQYRDIFEPLRPLIERYGIELHVAGTLADGGTAWIAGKLPEGYSIVHKDGRSDAHYEWVTAQGAHDQSVVHALYASMLRIECRNMLMAAQNGMAAAQKVRMRGSVESVTARWAAAIDRFGDAIAQQRLARVAVQQLADAPFTVGQFDSFAANLLLEAENRSKTEQAAMSSLFGEDATTRTQAKTILLGASADPDLAHARLLCKEIGVGTDAPISRRSAALFAKRHDRLSELFVKGIGNRGCDRYDALNAVTQWVDADGVRGHRGDETRSAERRFVSALNGEGAAIKGRAFDMLVSDMVGA